MCVVCVMGDREREAEELRCKLEEARLSEKRARMRLTENASTSAISVSTNYMY